MLWYAVDLRSLFHHMRLILTYIFRSVTTFAAYLIVMRAHRSSLMLLAVIYKRKIHRQV